MKNNAVILSCFFLLFFSSYFSQNSRIDSLQRKLSTLKDTGRAETLYSISSYYFKKGALDSCLKYSGQVVELYEKTTDKKKLVEANNNIANIYAARGEYEQAKKYYLRSLALNQELKDELGIAISYGSLSSVVLNSNDFEGSKEYSLKYLEIVKKLGNKNEMATAYGQLGNVYINQGDYPKALEYYLECTRLLEQLKDEKRLAAIYTNIGVIYYFLKKQDLALDHYLKSFKISEKLDNKPSMLNDLQNIGLIYSEKGKHKEAMQYYQKAREVAERAGSKALIASSYEYIGSGYLTAKEYPNARDYFLKALPTMLEMNNQFAVAQIYLGLGEVYQAMGQPKEAIDVEERGLKLLEGIGNLESLKSAYATLADAYKSTGDYKNALKYQELLLNVKDSLLSQEDVDKMAGLKADFEVEKKEKELQMQNMAKEAKQKEALLKQKAITYSVMGGGLLMLVLALVTLRGYNQKRKANEQISLQKHQIEEKNKDITDSINYANRIQRGFLPSETEMNKALGDYFVLYQPKDIVSGDFYWLADVHTSDPSKPILKVAVLAVVDCTGHGVPGALMSIVGNTLLNQTIRNPEINSPADALNYLNKELPKNIKSQKKGDAIRDGMDMAMCAIDFTNKDLYFAGANNPVYLVSEGVLTELKGEKQPISGSDEYEKRDFTNKKAALKKGDMVYLFTDGFADQFGGPDQKKFKYRQLKELLVEVSDKSTASQKEIIQSRFNEWKGSNEQVDDVLLIGIRV